MRYGDIPKTLVAHGWDYDIVNDHLLQERCQIRGEALVIAGHVHRVVVLAGSRFVPAGTLSLLARFAESGGTVIACGLHPDTAAPFVKIPDYPTDRPSYSPQFNEYEPTPNLSGHHRRLIEAVARALPPDLLLPPDALPSQGLCHHHRRLPEADIYFLANLQPAAFQGDVRLAARRRFASRWHPVSGQVADMTSGAQSLSLHFEPWESYFIVLSDAQWTSDKTKPNSSNPLRGKLSEHHNSSTSGHCPASSLIR